MIKYVSIKSALRFIPKPLFRQSNELDFMSWMLDAYRELDLPATFENKVQIFEIDNGKLELPQEIKEINLISYLANEPSNNDIYSLTDCICNPESNANEEDTNNPCQYTLSYKMFLTSSYYKNNYAPLLYVGNRTQSLLCNDCPNLHSSCKNTFTIDKDNILHTNLDKGYLCIDYTTEMVDENGEFLILDLTEVKRYLAYYAEYQHWRERAAVKEQSAGNMAQDALIKAETWLKKCRGILILRGINPHDIANVQGGAFNRLINLPEKYVYSR